MLTLCAEGREPLIGSLRKDGLEIDMELIVDPSDFADCESQFESSTLVFYGAFPAFDDDGINAVTLTIPDNDGITRSHPY